MARERVRTIVLTVLAAVCAVQAGPAVAQEETTMLYEETRVAEQTEAFEGFGVIEFVGQKADGTRGYGLSVDAETGYYLEGDFDFSAFEGQRVFAVGQIVYGPGERFLQVESIEAADASQGGRTVTFELTTEGTVPAGESFYAYAPDGYGQQLTDPDGDGVYTGELAFPDGNYPLDQAIPLSIGGLRDAEYPNGYTIRDFGSTVVEDGQTLSAAYAFGAGQGGGTTANEATGATASATASGPATTPEQTVVGEAATPDAGGQQGGIFQEGGALGFLPDSGGTAVLVLAVGAVLVGGGLLAYRFVR